MQLNTKSIWHNFIDLLYFLIGTKMKTMKYHFNFVNISKKLREIREKSPFFCCFGGSAGITEASAELFRLILTEASAEASVSVVH